MPDSHIREVKTMDMVPFQFEGMTLRESCWIDGKPYFTGQAIGDWLEYKFPREAINKIVERNPHINDPRWSTEVKLTSVEGDRDVIRVVRTYDPIGFQLIVFESRQRKAIRYKIAVANLAYAYMRGELVPSKWVRDGDLLAASRQIISLPHGSERRKLISDLADQHGCSIQTAYKRVERATGERLKTTKGGVINRRTKGQTQYPEEKEMVLAYAKAHPTAGGKQIRRELALQVSASRINAWLRAEKRLY